MDREQAVALCLDTWHRRPPTLVYVPGALCDTPFSVEELAQAVAEGQHEWVHDPNTCTCILHAVWWYFYARSSCTWMTRVPQSPVLSARLDFFMGLTINHTRQGIVDACAQLLDPATRADVVCIPDPSKYVYEYSIVCEDPRHAAQKDRLTHPVLQARQPMTDVHAAFLVCTTCLRDIRLFYLLCMHGKPLGVLCPTVDIFLYDIGSLWGAETARQQLQWHTNIFVSHDHEHLRAQQKGMAAVHGGPE